MSFPHGIDLSTDWHCHLLPGLDDGPATLEESLEMARLLAAAGVKIAHCTPHFIKGSYEHTPDEIRQAVAALQRELNKHDIELELRAGMEYLLDEFFQQQLNNPLPLGTSNLLLIEAYPTLSIELLKEHIFTIKRHGLTPLLAHPERNMRLATSPAKRKLWTKLTRPLHPATLQTDDTSELLTMGCLFQGNLGSLTGYYGKHVFDQAALFQSQNIYGRYGSDAHSPAQCKSILQTTKPKS